MQSSYFPFIKYPLGDCTMTGLNQQQKIAISSHFLESYHSRVTENMEKMQGFLITHSFTVNTGWTDYWECQLLADLLADVFVLVQALFGQVALPQVHTELQVLEHNRFVDLLPCSMFLAFDDIIQHIQSWLLFANLKKLWTNKLYC